MKLFLLNCTRFPTPALRRAIVAGLQRAGWPEDKPILVRCWHGRWGYRLQDTGFALWQGKRAELWEFADQARWVVCRARGAMRNQIAPLSAHAPSWAALAGLTAPPPRPYLKDAPARRLDPSAWKPKLAELEAKWAKAEARREGALHLRRLGDALDRLGAR